MRRGAVAAESGGVGAQGRLRAWQLALAATLLAWAWMAFQAQSAYGGNWTGLFYHSAELPLPAELRDGTYVRCAFHGYDGQQYRVIAHDIWPPFRANNSLDAPVLRRQRMLVPALAWILGLGRRAWIDAAYIAVILASIFGGVLFSAKWFALRGKPATLGLLFLLTPPAVASVDRMLVDATLLALIVAAAFCWDTRRWPWTWLALALACLTRETGVLAVTGSVAALWWRRDWRRGAWMAMAALPLLAWRFLLLSAMPDSGVKPAFGCVFCDIFIVFFACFEGQITVSGVLNAAGLLGLAVCLPLALWQWWTHREESPGWMAVTFVAAGLFVAPVDGLMSPMAYGRYLGPLVAWLLLDGVRRRSWWTVFPMLICAGPLAYSFAALLRGLGLAW